MNAQANNCFHYLCQVQLQTQKGNVMNLHSIDSVKTVSLHFVSILLCIVKYLTNYFIHHDIVILYDDMNTIDKDLTMTKTTMTMTMTFSIQCSIDNDSSLIDNDSRR